MSEAVHVLLGYPPSANRLVRLGRGVPYKSKAVTAWTKDAVARLRAVRPKVLEGPVVPAAPSVTLSLADRRAYIARHRDALVAAGLAGLVGDADLCDARQDAA